jgi:hypothetical protein
MSSKKDSKKGSKKSGNLNYLHKVVQQSVKDGKASTLEEIVVDGPKGLSVKYFSKSGDDADKIVIYGKDDTYKMKSGDVEKTLTKSELLDELKSNKKLKFAADYAKTQKGGSLTGGAKKKSSKKSSKKGSKKGSKTMKGGEELVEQTGGAKKKSSKKASKTKKTSKKGSKTMKGGEELVEQTGGAKSKKTSKTKKTSKKASKKSKKM